MILGLDPATRCGFALLRRDGARVQSGTWLLKRPSEEYGVTIGHGLLYVRLVDRLDGLLRAFPTITHVAYESPGGHMPSRHVALSLYGLAAHVESWAERNDLVYREYAPKEVKVAAGLTGSADKAEMIAAAEKLWAPHSIEFDDEADAMFCALALLKGER